MEAVNSRRTVLVAAGAAALAGCSNSGDGGGSSTPTPSALPPAPPYRDYFDWLAGQDLPAAR
ncbi:hypothetical protein ABZ726_16195, partial [Streptomyces hundungensis]